MIGTKSAEDRGSADSYYRRGPRPHKFVDGVEVLLEADSAEGREYMRAYYENERLRNRKEYE